MTARAQQEELARDGVAPIVVDLAAPGVYPGLIQLAHFVEQTIRAMPLEAMVEACRQASAFAPFADPTLWRAKGQAMREDEHVLEVLRSAQKQLQRLHERARS
jgi:hypothetical protein